MTHSTVVDLFSGGGGASAGFKATGSFRITGAADAQIGKPSSGSGSLSCNSTYFANIGTQPVVANLGIVGPDFLADAMQLEREPDVLIACPPCTGFSRTVAKNHLSDDVRNGLVPRMADFVAAWRPKVVVMENARELVTGRFRQHLQALSSELREQGYEVSASTHFLDRFGLPQRRERALVLASLREIKHRTIEDLWRGRSVDAKATHVRRAIWHLPALEAGERDPFDPSHVAPRIVRPEGLRRTRSIPHDGGSWVDLLEIPGGREMLTPAMTERAAVGNYGSHPDVYGRMWWDRPAPTIKRECSHVGNGRYTHPNQDRLCSIREMAILNGFPQNYLFSGGMANSYRHIGDAVPPLISYQLARLVEWMLTDQRPEPDALVLPQTHLQVGDIVSS